MSKTIQYSSVEYQIDKMKKQGLTIRNEDFAKTMLIRNGYSNLIKSYRDPYVIIGPEGVSYRPGITFDQVASLYIFDKNLRNAVMSSMLDLEEHIKALSADIIAKDFGTDHNYYLDKRNYRNKKYKNKHFSLDAILTILKDALDMQRDPILHCRITYRTVPPWILFNGVYFSTIVNFIDKFKRPQMDALSHRLFKKDVTSTLNDEQLRYLLMDSLFIYLEYRNLAAHGGRIYNYNTKANLRTKEIYSNTGMHLTGFSKLLFLLEQLDYQNPFDYLRRALNNELTRHCSSYVEDVTYLAQTLNVNIIRSSEKDK